MLSDKQKRKLLRIVLLIGKLALRMAAKRYGIDAAEIVAAIDDVSEEIQNDSNNVSN